MEKESFTQQCPEQNLKENQSTKMQRQEKSKNNSGLYFYNMFLY